MINHLLDWLHNRLLSLWGNIPAWGVVGWQFMFGQMSGIMVISAVLAAWLTWLSIMEKLRRQRNLDLLGDALAGADEADMPQLREWVADEIRTMRTTPGKLD